MSRLGLTPSISMGIAASAAGSASNAAADRAGKLDAANHSLAGDQKALSSHPLDRDPNTSADRDADGWTGGDADDATEPVPPRDRLDPDATPPCLLRPRLPDDPCGGSLDVVV